MTTPFQVGILDDMADGPPGVANIEPWLRLAIDDLRAAGRIDREVTYVYAYGLGLPSGAAAAVERAYAQLAETGALMIVGPAIGDNALVATPLAEKYHVPTLNWAGSERARSDYMFHLQVGSHEDESILMARHMAALGCARLGVAYDRSPIGRRHLQFLEDECDRLGVRIDAKAMLSPLAQDATDEVDRILAAQPDGFVYLGLGLSAPAAAQALTARGWQGPRIMNTAGLRGMDPAFARKIDHWIYVDMVSDSNRTLRQIVARTNHTGPTLMAAKGHDLGRLVAEGLARASELTRDGVKHGLEQIKWLPAAEGEEGTLLSFGTQDRGALHGRYLVLRQWVDGRSIEVPR